jgi:hypothetical protein
MEPGIRVTAIRNADANTKTLYIYGHGTYLGNFIPAEEGLNWPIPNSKIQLDNGSIIWGFQCWWGSEEGFQKILTPGGRFEGYTVEEVSVPQE